MNSDNEFLKLRVEELEKRVKLLFFLATDKWEGVDYAHDLWIELLKETNQKGVDVLNEFVGTEISPKTLGVTTLEELSFK